MCSVAAFFNLTARLRHYRRGYRRSTIPSLTLSSLSLLARKRSAVLLCSPSNLAEQQRPTRPPPPPSPHHGVVSLNSHLLLPCSFSLPPTHTHALDSNTHAVRKPPPSPSTAWAEHRSRHRLPRRPPTVAGRTAAPPDPLLPPEGVRCRRILLIESSLLPTLTSNKVHDMYTNLYLVYALQISDLKT